MANLKAALKAHDPDQCGILIREINAHSEAVNGLSAIELSDCNGLMSSSKDHKVLVWSLDLDVWGKINQASEEDGDPKWTFPSDERMIKHQDEIDNLESVLDKINFGYSKPRMKLVTPIAR